MSNINEILILTNTIDMGGRETRLLDEMKVLKSEYDVEFHLINLFHNKSQRATDFLSKYAALTDYNLPSKVSEISVDLVIDTVSEIIHYCRRHNIQAIYIHNSDIEALIGTFAAQYLKVPIFCTLHGKGMVFSNRLNPVLHFVFYYLVAPSLSLLITMSHSLKDIMGKYPFKKVLALPNAVDCDYFIPIKKNVESTVHERWLLISRLSIEKYLGVFKFIEYAYRSGIKGLDIVGDGNFRKYIESELKECGLEGYVNFLGEQTVNSELLNKYDVIAGVGRVILEAIATEKLAFVIGTGGNEYMSGFVNNTNISEVAHENFSGRNLKSLNYEEFRQQLETVKNIEVEKLRSYVIENNSHNLLKEKYTEYVCNLEFQNNPLIADLYSSLSYFRSSISEPFYLQNSFISILENLVYSEYYNADLERAFVLMRERLEKNFQYPNNNHQKSYHLKLNRPVLKGDALLTKENLTFKHSSTEFKISNYNYDINSKYFYIVFLHFHHKTLLEENKKYGVVIQIELYDLLRRSEIVCASDIESIVYSESLGFYRVLYFNHNNLRDGVRLRLAPHIAITSIRISSISSNIDIDVDKLHVWLTYE